MEDQKRNKMLVLSFIAYCGFLRHDVNVIKRLIKEALNINKIKNLTGQQKIVWGPVIHRPNILHRVINLINKIFGIKKIAGVFSDSLMYIVEDNQKELTLIIRGTNPVSLYAWMIYDLNIKKFKNWNKINKTTQANNDVKISKGSFLSLKTLVKLIPKRDMPGSKKNFIDFFNNIINEKGEIRINITGHSLGGVMASTIGLLVYH